MSNVLSRISISGEQLLLRINHVIIVPKVVMRETIL